MSEHELSKRVAALEERVERIDIHDGESFTERLQRCTWLTRRLKEAAQRPAPPDEREPGASFAESIELLRVAASTAAEMATWDDRVEHWPTLRAKAAEYQRAIGLLSEWDELQNRIAALVERAEKAEESRDEWKRIALNLDGCVQASHRALDPTGVHGAALEVRAHLVACERAALEAQRDEARAELERLLEWAWKEHHTAVFEQHRTNDKERYGWQCRAVAVARMLDQLRLGIPKAPTTIREGGDPTGPELSHLPEAPIEQEQATPQSRDSVTSGASADAGAPGDGAPPSERVEFLEAALDTVAVASPAEGAPPVSEEEPSEALWPGELEKVHALLDQHTEREGSLLSRVSSVVDQLAALRKKEDDR